MTKFQDEVQVQHNASLLTIELDATPAGKSPVASTDGPETSLKLQFQPSASSGGGGGGTVSQTTKTTIRLTATDASAQLGGSGVQGRIALRNGKAKVRVALGMAPV